MVQNLSKSKSTKQNNQGSEPISSSSITSKYFGICLSLITLLAGLAYFMLANNCPKFSRAEVFFAECTKEMLGVGDIITPLYHSVPFFDKPILTYWLIAISYQLFGISHIAARIPSILAALATVGLTGFVAYRAFNAHCGLIAALCLATSFLYMSFSTLCMSDMLLVFFDTATLALLYSSCNASKFRHCYLYTAALSMGLAFLVKGPVGIALPGLAFVIYLTASKNWHKIEFKHAAIASTILVIACSPWFYAAYRENGLGALSYFFIRENLQRFAGSTYDSHRPIWFMFTAFLSGFLPWSIFIPFALKEHFSASKKQNLQVENYLWLWLTLLLGFFSLSRGKIDYYALPCYPAAAILVSNYLVKLAEQKTFSIKLISLSAASIFLVLSIASTFFASSTTLFNHIYQWIAIPVLAFVIASLLFRSASKQKYLQSIYIIGASILVLACVIASNFIPCLFKQQTILSFCPIVKRSSQQTDIAVYTNAESWIDEITYQTNKEPFKIANLKTLMHFIKRPTPTLFIVPDTIFAQIPPADMQKLKVIAEGPFITRTVTVGYILQNYKNIGKESRLLLIANSYYHD